MGTSFVGLWGQALLGRLAARGESNPAHHPVPTLNNRLRNLYRAHKQLSKKLFIVSALV
jgi:hypothetical protein